MNDITSRLYRMGPSKASNTKYFWIEWEMSTELGIKRKGNVGALSYGKELFVIIKMSVLMNLFAVEEEVEERKMDAVVRRTKFGLQEGVLTLLLRDVLANMNKIQ